MEKPDLLYLETALGYTFKNTSFLVGAVTHPSYSFEKKESSHHYQRLEFLGDAILGAILGHMLFLKFPEEREGGLANMRSVLASGQTLSRIAQTLNLGQYIKMSPTEHAVNGQFRPTVLEDTLEALIGAIYLDSQNFDITYKIISRLYDNIEANVSTLFSEHNPKGKLQEWFQERFSSNGLEYRLIGTSGLAHQKTFFIEVWANGEMLSSGSGLSKKEAEESAAKEALKKLEA